MAASTVGPRGPYDLILQDKASSPSTSVGLVLDRDEDGKPRVREFRVPPVPPRSSSGALAESHLDPMVDYIYVQDDWSAGALQVYYKDGSRRYAEADGVDARWEGVLALGPQKSQQLSVIIGNTSFESGSVAPFTTTAGPQVDPIANGNARTGSYAMHVNGSFTNTFSLALPNPTALQGRSITFGGWAKVISQEGVHARFQIVDSVGTTTQSIGTSTSYEFTSVTRTIDAAATSVTLQVDQGATATDVWVDDLILRVAAADTCVGIVEAAGNYYAAVGPYILIWDETNDYWKHSTFQAASVQATSIMSFKNKVYVGYGLSTAYIYGVDGSWTVASGGSGNDTYAQFFTVMDDRLWKNEAANTVRRSSAAATIAATEWVEPFTVGEVSSPITNLYMLNHAIVAGTETGLHAKLTDDGSFINLTNWFVADPNADNFARGVVRGGWLYTTTAKQGLMRFNGSILEDLSELFMAPRYTNYGGRVKAVTQDQHQLYLLVDTPTVDTSLTKTTRLMSLRELGSEWQLHILNNVDIADINILATAGSYLYGIGRLSVNTAGTYYISGFRWKLPEKSAAPYADDITVRALEVSGTINLPIVHAPMTASLIKLELLCQDTDATVNYITPAYGIDGAAPSTPAGWAASTTVTSTPGLITWNASTLTTPTNAKGDFWQFKFTLTRDSTQAAGAHVSPKIYMVRAHFVLSPTPVPAWEFHIRLGAPRRNGMPDPRSQSAIRADLNTLENQDYPITLVEDLDQDDAQSAHYVRIREWERILEDTEHKGGKPTMHGELYRLVVQKIV